MAFLSFGRISDYQSLMLDKQHNREREK